MALTDDIILIELGLVPPPGGNVSLTDWNTLRADVDGLKLLVPGSLAGLTDTVITSPVADQLLVRDGPSGKWVNRTVGESVRYVKNGSTVVVDHADRIAAGVGLVAAQNGSISTQADLSVVFGGTGAANTVARADHSHSPVVFADFDFAATGVLSSGTRTLVSSNLTGLDPTKAYYISARLEFTIRNNINAGTVTASVRLGASATYPAKSKSRRSVGGVDREIYLEHQRPVSGSSSIQVTVTVALDAGSDPMDIRDGVVYVSAIPQS